MYNSMIYNAIFHISLFSISSSLMYITAKINYNYNTHTNTNTHTNIHRHKFKNETENENKNENENEIEKFCKYKYISYIGPL